MPFGLKKRVPGTWSMAHSAIYSSGESMFSKIGCGRPCTVILAPARKGGLGAPGGAKISVETKREKPVIGSMQHILILESSIEDGRWEMEKV
jgi:hypothetical protein